MSLNRLRKTSYGNELVFHGSQSSIGDSHFRFAACYVKSWSVKEQVKTWLAKAGGFFPHSFKVGLARRSSKWGHLLRNDGDFIFDNYLGEYKVHINAIHNVEREMLSGSYEVGLQRLIENQVQAGDVCIDIGANFGAITLALCRQVGPSGKVISFEPGPDYFKRLNSNISLNHDLKKISEVYSVGISNQPGELFWAEDPSAPGNAGLLETSGRAVPVTTLDDFVEEKNIERLSFIKIDTEGMETEVLEGARKALQKFRPKVVFETLMDFEAIRKRPIRKEAEAFFLSLNYQIYDILDDGSIRKTSYPNFGLNSLALPS